LQHAIYLQSLTIPYCKPASLAAATAATVVVVVLAKPVPCALVVVMVGLVVMVELVEYALVVVMAKPVVMTELVDYVVVVVMAELLVHALVLPPVAMSPMMRDAKQELVLVRYDQEQPKAMDQLVRYLVYATKWYCRGILQGNASHLQWGCLSRDPHSLV
jgi:hypothetical protein